MIERIKVIQTEAKYPGLCLFASRASRRLLWVELGSISTGSAEHHALHNYSVSSLGCCLMCRLR